MKKYDYNPLIVALDVASEEEVKRACLALKDSVGLFKVGLELFSALGGKALELAAKRSGKGIFLDFKLHDIPTTVKKAIYQLSKNSAIEILNVHALGGAEMMEAAMRGADECFKETGQKPKIIAVTVLTSISADDLSKIGIGESPTDAAVKLAKLAFESGLDGVVCSVEDVPGIKKMTSGDFLTVCPGIRPGGSAVGDQKRIATPKAAAEAGADYIVVGRPVLQAENMVEASNLILKEMGAF